MLIDPSVGGDDGDGGEDMGDDCQRELCRR